MDAVARATHLEQSSSPRPPVAPRVCVPLIAPLAHVLVVRLTAVPPAPLLRAAPALHRRHCRPQTACFGTSSTATTAAAVTGHAAAAGTVVLCVSMWNLIRSFLYAHGLMRLQPPIDALLAVGSALQRVAYPFCSDAQPINCGQNEA